MSKNRKRWIIEKCVRIPLGIFALIYAAAIIYSFSIENMSSIAIIIRESFSLHLLCWTISPPIWFLIEYWAVSPEDEKEFRDLKYGQELASKLWAAVLVVLLYFSSEGPLQKIIDTLRTAPGQ